jgi:hypothetical protein
MNPLTQLMYSMNQRALDMAARATEQANENMLLILVAITFAVIFALAFRSEEED